MILKPDNAVRVCVDEKENYECSIKEDRELLKPKEISAPEDKRHDVWMHGSMMDDPDDKKPDDWVEESRIVDQEAMKPGDRDDKEDREWKVKRISNPAYTDKLAFTMRVDGGCA